MTNHGVTAILGLLLVTGTGCAMTKAYPGPRRPASELGFVVGAWEDHQSVEILRVTGEGCGTEPCKQNGEFFYLLPGTYQFDVKRSASGLWTGVLIVDLVTAIQAQDVGKGTEQRIEFSVTAGHRHQIHYDDESQTYALDVRPGGRFDGLRSPLAPPEGAAMCTLAQPDEPRPICTVVPVEGGFPQ